MWDVPAPALAPLPPGAPETGVADSRGNLVKPAMDERSCRHKIFQLLFELPGGDPRYLEHGEKLHKNFLSSFLPTVNFESS